VFDLPADNFIRVLLDFF